MSLKVLRKKNDSDIAEKQKLREENARLKKQCAAVANGPLQILVRSLEKENAELTKNLKTTSQVLGKEIRGYKRALDVSSFLTVNDILTLSRPLS